jgi:radical SAM superfamily enzyme YgiQ (UPF0313 family)
MRLLLTHGYFLMEDPKEQRIMKPYAPLGILSISAHLRNKGFDVDIYDSTFGTREELFRILDNETPGALGIYGNLMTRRNVLDLIARGREAGWKVILGGPEPPNYAEEFLTAGADLIVAGEAELSMERLLTSELERSRWASIPGLIYRGEDGTVVRTGPAELISNLDAQPWPDRERVDIPQYLKVWREHHGAGSVSLITARGCPYHCNWCSHSVYGKSHRRRSPHSVVDEVEWILNRYQPEMIWFADDVFTIHHGWITEYAAEMNHGGCMSRSNALRGQIDLMLVWLRRWRSLAASVFGSARKADRSEYWMPCSAA